MNDTCEDGKKIIDLIKAEDWDIEYALKVLELVHMSLINVMETQARENSQ